jgi:hypothetical protein
MTRLGTWFWLLLAASTGFAMFMVKYTVQNLEDELVRVRKQTVAEQREIRVLNAEWSYLTQPERLSELNRQFLNLVPITIRQLQSRIADLPLRPPPAPPVDVAAAAEPSAPAALEPAPPDPAITPAVMARAVDAAPPKPGPAPAAPTLDALFAQVAGER